MERIQKPSGIMGKIEAVAMTVCVVLMAMLATRSVEAQTFSVLSR